MNGVIRVIVPTIEAIIDNNHRAVVIAQRAPTDIIVSVIPVHPGWPPSSGRDPVPSQVNSPMPSAVVRNTPAPWFIGAPCPSTNGIPDPSSMVIGPPGVVVDIGNPNVSIGPLIHPSAIVGQFGFIFMHFSRQILCPHIPVVEDIPAPVPLRERILVCGIDVIGSRGKHSVGYHQFFSATDHLRTLFSSGFDGSLYNKKGCFLIIPDLEAIKAFFQNIKRSIRTVNLKFLFYVQGVHTQKNIPREQMEAD
jgi:hypothetical protein